MPIKDLMPASMRCSTGMSCPSIRRLEDGRLLIVGQSIDETTPLGDIGDNEDAIIISEELLSDLIAEKMGCQANTSAKGEASSREGALQTGAERIAIRSAVLEEAAQVADQYAEKAWAAEDVAEDIRALKSPTQEAGE